MIKLLIELLLIGTTCIIFTPKHKLVLIRFFGLGTSCITFLFSLFLWFFFDNSTYKLQFVSEISWLPQSNINLTVGIDGFSLFFVLLSTLLIPICLLSCWSSIIISVKEFFIIFLLLEIVLILVFSVSDLLLFYIFFESILVPTGWILVAAVLVPRGLHLNSPV